MNTLAQALKVAIDDDLMIWFFSAVVQ